jgi:hypothetical protein
MLALIATPTEEFIARRNAIRDSWTVAERKHRALVAHVKQHELIVLLRLLPEIDGKADSSTRIARRFRA